MVSARFKTSIGKKALFKLTRHDGKKVPFGAVVSSATADDNKRVVGIVNESGEVYMSGLSEKGQLDVKWSSHGSCKAVYKLSDNKSIVNIYNASLTCI